MLRFNPGEREHATAQPINTVCGQEERRQESQGSCYGYRPKSRRLSRDPSLHPAVPTREQLMAGAANLRRVYKVED